MYRIVKNIIFYFRLILGNYLAERGMEATKTFKAALIISVPWNLFEAVKNFEKPYLNLMLNRHLADNLCKNLKKYEKASDVYFADINMESALKVRR